MQHDYETTLELDVTLRVSIVKERPAPPCSNPDSPSFSDPGDPGEQQVEAVLLYNLRTKKFIDITDCISEKYLKELANEAYEAIVESYENV